MRKLLIALGVYVAVAVGLSSVAVAGIDEGIAAYARGDYATALKEFRVQADQGNAEAQYGLGQIYLKALGVGRNDKEAAKWFRKAAEQGEVLAQFNFGVAYREGKGITQDYKEAAKWFRKAAEKGIVDAQYNLGLMYDYGYGVTQDYVLTHMWFNIAAANGDNKARDKRDILEKRMTASDILKAQELAKEWMAKHQK